MAPPPTLLKSLTEIVGEAHVSADDAVRDIASSDIAFWPERTVADLVIQPGTTEETSRVLVTLSKNRVNVVPRLSLIHI